MSLRGVKSLKGEYGIKSITITDTQYSQTNELVARAESHRTFSFHCFTKYLFSPQKAGQFKGNRPKAFSCLGSHWGSRTGARSSGTLPSGASSAWLEQPGSCSRDVVSLLEGEAVFWNKSAAGKPELRAGLW